MVLLCLVGMKSASPSFLLILLLAALGFLYALFPILFPVSFYGVASLCVKHIYIQITYVRVYVFILYFAEPTFQSGREGELCRVWYNFGRRRPFFPPCAML